MTQHGIRYGNLMSYKIHILPAAYKLYGGHNKKLTKHQKDVQDLLHTLFATGSCTTWDMAKMRYSRTDKIRAKEKGYRRLLVGRTDGSSHNYGIFDLGLVLKNEKQTGKKTSQQYRLSLHGILYCMDVLDPTNREIDIMTKKYSDLLPRVFGRWKYLKQVLKSDVYKLRILSKGMLLDSPIARDPCNPLYALMSFIHVKYARNLESITEHDLAEQISYWFYTFLLYPHLQSRKTQGRSKRIRGMLESDADLHGWYSEFFHSASIHYTEIIRGMNNVSLSKNTYVEDR